MSKNKFLLVLATIFLALLVYFAMNFKWSEDIDVALGGVQYQLGADNSSVESKTVKINGTVKKSWLGYKAFHGTLDIEGEALLQPYREKEITITFNEHDYGDIVYGDVNNGIPHVFQYGLLFMDDDLSEVVIAPLTTGDNTANRGWTAGDGLLIVAPALNKAEGNLIANELMKKFIGEYELR